MACRTLTAAALFVVLAAPALADSTTTTTSSTSCWRGTCTTESKTEHSGPPKPNVGYLPNFSGTAGGGSAASSETVYFNMPRSAEPAAPVDPKCAKLNACLKIH